MNEVELNPSLWLYAIHSQNADLIHLLEYHHVKPPNGGYLSCFIESIKCHHHDFAEYFMNNYLSTNNTNFLTNEEVYSNILKYHNYAYLKYCIRINSFFYLCSNNYNKLVKLFILKNIDDIKSKMKNIIVNESISSDYIDVIYYSFLNKKSVTRKSLTKYDCQFSQIALPSSIILIEKDTFQYNTELKNISIPSSVIVIRDCAFDGCTSLTEIVIPSSVKSIGIHAFDNCTSLKKIEIPSSVTLLDDYTFASCTSLIQIIIPISVTYIGNYVFCQCKKLPQIFIPSSVKSIGTGAFEECSSLQQIKIPSSVTSIGIDAFSLCKSLQQITIPSSLNIHHLGIESNINIIYVT